MSTTKQFDHCTKCNKYKPIEQFLRDSKRYWHCRDCFDVIQKRRKEDPKIIQTIWRKQPKKNRPFVVYVFKILNGEYAGWFYIGQSRCFVSRFRDHKFGHNSLPELTTALQGTEDVDWSLEFLEEHLDKPCKAKAGELEAKWMLRYIQDGKKLLNRQIPEEALKALFKRGAF